MTVGAGVPDEEPTSGVAAVDEDGALDESAGLVAGADFALSRDDARTLGKDLKSVAGVDVAFAVPVAAAVAADPLAGGVEAVWLGAGVVQGAVGAGPALVVVPDGLACWLGLEVTVPLGLGLGLEVTVPLGLGLGLEVTVSLGLGFPLSEGLALVLAAAVLSSPLDDTAGLVVTASCVGELVLPDEPDVVGVAEVCVEADAQVALGLGAMPAMLPDESTALGDPEATPWPSVDPGPDELEVPLMTEPKFEERWAISLRVVGTMAKTTPRRNTARPVAKAGRSIASRQSVGRFGARCSDERSAGSTRRTHEPRYRASWAPNAAMAPQAAITPCRPVAWADRDWIFSRIRSRPSAPGWIWSPAACSSRRRNSPKSCPWLPSKPRPGLTMSPVPAPRAARPFRALCGS